MGSDFRAKVLSIVRRVPRGRVTTYGDVAVLAGAPRAARAVGTVMRKCGDPRVPCHRVIAAGGGLGGYGAFLHVKRDLLRAEGLEVGMTRVRHFADVRWPGPPSPRRVATRPDKQCCLDGLPRRPSRRAGNLGSRRPRLTLQKT